MYELRFRQTILPMAMKLHYFNSPSRPSRYATNQQSKKMPNKGGKTKPNFKNMFGNLATARSGCGSCSGTR